MLYSELTVEWPDQAKCFVVVGSVMGKEWYRGCLFAFLGFPGENSVNISERNN